MKNVIEALTNLKSNPIPGGFEDVLGNQIVNKNEKNYLKDVELFVPEASRREPLELSSLRKVIVDSLVEYLSVRMEGQNENLLSAIEAFLKFDKEFDVSTIHSLVGKDLDLASFHLQYTDMSNSSDEIKSLPLLQLIKYLSDPSRITFFRS